MNWNLAIDILHKWYEFHHGGCNDQTTCSISEAWDNGYTLWAIYELESAIGICPGNSNDPELEMKAEKAWNHIHSKPLLKKRWDRETENERQELVNTVLHMECICGAIIWQPDFCEGYCSSCGHTNGWPTKQPVYYPKGETA